MRRLTRREFGIVTGTACGAILLPRFGYSMSGSKEKPVRVLIVTGRNNHDWKRTTPLMKGILEACDRFSVSVTEAPSNDDEAAWSRWRPAFDEADVVLSDYNGHPWPEPVRQRFEAYVRGGGGVVIQHAANNAFPGWESYERMVGLLWRDPDDGYRVYLDDDGRLHRLPPGEGRGAGHGALHDWSLTTRDSEHPIMHGLPKVWLHPHDELYHAQRGPAEKLHILTTAYSDPEHGGTGRHEPQIWWIPFGKGRVLTFLPGHLWAGQDDLRAFRCVGLRTLLQRSCEWAATGEVTIPIPTDFPTRDEARLAATPTQP